jgi:hypothetical protein
VIQIRDEKIILKETIATFREGIKSHSELAQAISSSVSSD